MTQVKITRATELVTGGCNACGPVKATLFMLTINGREHVFDDLSVQPLVMTLALASGYQQELKVNVLEEYTLFHKDTQQVKLVETAYDQLCYTNGTVERKTHSNLKDTTVLLATVNEILQEVFHLAPFDFVFET